MSTAQLSQASQEQLLEDLMGLLQIGTIDPKIAMCEAKLERLRRSLKDARRSDPAKANIVRTYYYFLGFLDALKGGQP
jgi:uncharacterized small protein (DUF1192 family)